MTLYKKYILDHQNTMHDIGTYITLYSDLSDFFSFTGGEKGRSKRDQQAKIINRSGDLNYEYTEPRTV